MMPCGSFWPARGELARAALSRFVEEAVQARILELAAEQAKAQNADTSPEAIDTAIDEALEWVRRA